jgi:hypothetical protein
MFCKSVLSTKTKWPVEKTFLQNSQIPIPIIYSQIQWWKETIAEEA